ncbi:tetratricopeptide repeat protein [Bacteroides cellulosilyticus]|jgi:hypothetical protein|uniref:Tetratricopeptide repeat protein n=1 Tax=Bacteroides cellulosilyticus TaxID=246787 RepID=A0A5M6A863_9BACE|nr:hypothetical protein [Bacteroides cellulosilyticus]KAA5408568.1 hypothetical protein F2Y86_14475 [Bacteroides cellulosilyticus]RYU17109.1 hypothetical protein EAJ01_13600 [Bacteroides cellulosilyticus]
MKNTVIIILFAMFLLSSCTIRQDYNQQLLKADSLMQLRPDSALNILKSISPEKLSTRADNAYYALLLTQAQDKNFVVQKDDSLIQIAVHYYDSIGDTKMQAKAHYYWGCVRRDKGEHLKAIDEYHISHSFAKMAKNIELPALIYSNVAYLYYVQELNEEADSIYQLAELLAIQQKDTISLIYALSQQGMINLERGKHYYSRAELQMQQALLLAEHFSDTTVKTPVYESLSTLYCEMGEIEKALQYAKLNYYSQRDTLHRCRASLLLGDAYFKNEQYDSAEVYLQSVFTEDRYYDTKADACMRLAEIAEIHGKTEIIAKMQQKQIAYMDSAQQKLQTHAILKNIVSQEKSNNDKIRKQYLYSIIVLVTFFSIAGCAIAMNYIRRNKKLKIAEEQQKPKLKVEIRKHSIIEEEYQSSAVYIKLKDIARTLIKVETKENLNEEEWQHLIVLTNIKWNGIITHLNTKYNLSGEEIQICCLYLAEIPVKHIGHFIKGYARSTVQLKAKNLLQKIKAPKGKLLKDVLLSLSQELKV